MDEQGSPADTPKPFKNPRHLGDFWFALGAFLLCIVGMIASPYLTGSSAEWIIRDRHIRQGLCLGVCSLAFLLGVWRLGLGLGIPRRSWSRRMLQLAVLPLLLVPAWITMRMYERPFDPSHKIRARDLPGYHLSLPDWPATGEVLDYWSGELQLHRWLTGEQVVVEWMPCADPPTLLSLHLDVVRAYFSDAAPAGEEGATAIGTSARTHYYRWKDQLIARTAWACPDGRMASVMTALRASQDALRTFHNRLVASVSCAPTTPPPPEFPTIKDLKGFVKDEEDPGVRIYTKDDSEELLMMSSLSRREGGLGLVKGASARSQAAKRLLSLLKLKGIGEAEEQTRSGREGTHFFWRQGVELADGERDIVTTTSWACSANGPWFSAAHFSGGLDRKDLGIERLLQITCPTKSPDRKE